LHRSLCVFIISTREKVQLILDLAVNHLPRAVRLSSLGFRQSGRSRSGTTAREEWNEEYYWVADVELPALRAAGLQAEFEAVSPYAGVFTIQRITPI
jgi:hypothetical protein